jgi:hypothetical protein
MEDFPMKIRLFITTTCATLLLVWGKPLMSYHCSVPMFSAKKIASLSEPKKASLDEVYSFFEADQDIHPPLNIDNLSQPRETTYLLRALTSGTPTVQAINALTECPCVNFSRTRCPCLRQWAEVALVRKMELEYHDKSLPLTYVSIGSGGMFFDFVLISKLIFAGFTNINIVLVDTAYADLIDRVKANRCTPDNKEDVRLKQFVRWFSFLQTTHAAHPRISLMLSNVYTQIVAEQSTDVLVIADLGLKALDLLDILVPQCFEILLKEHGTYVFLLEKTLTGLLAERVGTPLLHQMLALDVIDPIQGTITKKSNDLTVYVGTKGIPEVGVTQELPPGRAIVNPYLTVS